jgi:hypothetical protein
MANPTGIASHASKGPAAGERISVLHPIGLGRLPGSGGGV